MCLPLLAAIPGIIAGALGAGAGAGAATGVSAGIAAGTAAGASAASAAGLGVIGTSIATGLGTAAGTLGSLAGAGGAALGMSAGQFAFSMGSLAIGIGSSASSSAQAASAAKAQNKSIEKAGKLESDKEAIAGRQRASSAAAEIEKLAIEGARARGTVQASGLSPSQVARYARVARSTTMRDISSVQKNFEFSRASSLIDQRTIAENVRAQGRDTLSRAPTWTGLGLNVLGQGMDTGLKIASQP